ncbi:hypothetical protein MPTK2_3g20710 [Marchantia polymorpha subsp. ruderalis]
MTMCAEPRRFALLKAGFLVLLLVMIPLPVAKSARLPVPDVPIMTTKGCKTCSYWLTSPEECQGHWPSDRCYDFLRRSLKECPDCRTNNHIDLLLYCIANSRLSRSEILEVGCWAIAEDF